MANKSVGNETSRRREIAKDGCQSQWIATARALGALFNHASAPPDTSECREAARGGNIQTNPIHFGHFSNRE